MRSYDAEEHVYRTDAVGRLPGATDIIKTEGLVDTQWMTEEARWRGKCVHRGIELVNKKTIDWDTVDEIIAGYLRSYERFLITSKFEVIGSEEPCFSNAFGCLPDLWGNLNKYDSIVELKTGVVPAWAAFQTALQRRALMDDKGFRAVKRFGLRLMPDGSLANLVPFDDVNDDRRAMGMVDMFWWKKQHGYFKWQ